MVVLSRAGGDNAIVGWRKYGEEPGEMRRVDNDRTPHKARLHSGAWRGPSPKATAVSHPIIFTTLIEQLLSKHHLHSEGREGVY
jgi:hypothetical protein